MNCKNYWHDKHLEVYGGCNTCGAVMEVVYRPPRDWMSTLWVGEHTPLDCDKEKT